MYKRQFNPLVNLNGEWVDQIGQWEDTEGYYLKINDNCEDPSNIPDGVDTYCRNLRLTTQHMINLTDDGLDILLSQGWNMISFPIQSEGGVDVEVVFADMISSEELYGVINESGEIYVPGYITGDEPLNSIETMRKGEGYYVKALNSTTLTIYEPDEELLTFDNTVG